MRKRKEKAALALNSVHTDSYWQCKLRTELEIRGLCSLTGTNKSKMQMTCEAGKNFKRTFGSTITVCRRGTKSQGHSDDSGGVGARTQNVQCLLQWGFNSSVPETVCPVHVTSVVNICSAIWYVILFIYLF